MMNNCLFPESRYKREYWMSLYEVISTNLASGISFPFQYDSNDYNLIKFCSVFGDTFNPLTETWASSRYSAYPLLFSHKDSAPYVKQNAFVGDIWQTLKFRYRHEYIFPLSFYKDDSVAFNDWSAEEKAEFYKKSNEFTEKLLSIMEFTYERYSSLLSIYRNEEADLMAKVESITRFNDTPQNSGEFADDSHTTNITTSQNDYDTYMGRLREIQSYYANVLKDWSDEFSPLFIHEEGL